MSAPTDRRAAVTALLQRKKLDRLLLIGNGHHMIDLDNPVAHMAGYRSVGPALLVIENDGRQRLLAHADEEDAVSDLGLDEVRLSRDIAADLAAFIGSGATATVGLSETPLTLARAVLACLDGPAVDAEFYAATASKTVRELDAARRATSIAEEGYRYLLDVVRAGMAEQSGEGVERDGDRGRADGGVRRFHPDEIDQQRDGEDRAAAADKPEHQPDDCAGDEGKDHRGALRRRRAGSTAWPRAFSPFRTSR